MIASPRSFTAALLLLPSIFIVGLSSACRGPAQARPGPVGQAERVFWVGTRAYAAKVASLALRPEQAREAVAEFVRTKPGDAKPKLLLVGQHRCIVGESYHFFLPDEKGRIPRAGYYVDGRSGAVSYRAVQGTFDPARR